MNQQFLFWQITFQKFQTFWKVELRFNAFYFKNAKNTEGVLLKLILNLQKRKLQLIYFVETLTHFL
jgi:hypothetical protein